MTTSKMVPADDNNVDIGCGNAFGGDEDAGPAADIEMVNSVVKGFDLQMTDLGGSANFKAWMKDYMGAILEKMKAKDVPVDDRKAFRARAANIGKFFLSNYKDLDFYLGPSFNPEALMVVSMYEGESVNPNFYFILDGMDVVKC